MKYETHGRAYGQRGSKTFAFGLNYMKVPSKIIIILHTGNVHKTIVEASITVYFIIAK